jgi:uncharacterized protein YbjQ (UPF0145 family)
MDEPREPATEEAALAADLRRVEAGGIPLDAERRLRELREHGGAFTSDLSVADFALCHQLGLRPLAQVMGSSIYQVGWQSSPWTFSPAGFMFELDALSQAWNEVRTRAFDRLAEEARHAGADAVAGVQIRTGAYDFAENAVEYIVIGTAIGDASATARAGAAASAPVLTELSIADYAKLLRAGIEPLGVVAWSSAFFVAPSYMGPMGAGLGSLGFMQNQEYTEFTEGVYGARETVIARMTAQSQQLGASGVIGVRINHSVGPLQTGSGPSVQNGLMVTFHAIGTAIREREDAALPAPETTLELSS